MLPSLPGYRVYGQTAGAVTLRLAIEPGVSLTDTVLGDVNELALFRMTVSVVPTTLALSPAGTEPEML